MGRAAVITRCDSSPIFEPSEAVFDLVTLFVERLIVITLDFAVPFRRDAGLDAFFDEGLAEPVAVITTIAGQRLGLLRQGVDHEPCPFMIAHLPFGQKQDQRVTVAICHSMKL